MAPIHCLLFAYISLLKGEPEEMAILESFLDTKTPFFILFGSYLALCMFISTEILSRLKQTTFINIFSLFFRENKT